MQEKGKITSFDATRYLDHYKRRLVRRPVSLVLTEHSYPPGQLLERSWIPIVFRAFSGLASRLSIRDLLIIGTFYSGDLLSCVPADKQFCLVYENLPNIPGPEGIDLRDNIFSASFFDAGRQKVPELFNTHLLALHYLCLQQSHDRVRKGGGVLTSIGGRIPLEIIFNLHQVCHYSPELIVFDLKIQSEPETVLPEYCRAEEQNGVEFTFYAPEALALVTEGRLSGLDGRELLDSLKGKLECYAMSAREAMKRYLRGKDVAHSVFMVFGERQEINHAV
jgi:hypothetical protein